VEKLTIEVDCTAFRAIEMERHGHGSDATIAFRLDSGDVVILGPDHPLARTGADQSPRLSIRHGLEAELSRPVYYELAHIALEEEGHPPGFWSSGLFFALGEP
jgi:hypothetical protein